MEVPDGSDLKVRGKILDHEYEIKQNGNKVAEVSKRWCRMETCGNIEKARAHRARQAAT